MQIHAEPAEPCGFQQCKNVETPVSPFSLLLDHCPKLIYPHKYKTQCPVFLLKKDYVRK